MFSLIKKKNRRLCVYIYVLWDKSSASSSFFFSQTDQLIMAGAAEYNQETHGMYRRTRESFRGGRRRRDEERTSTSTGKY